jgi:hypothetical protein
MLTRLLRLQALVRSHILWSMKTLARLITLPYGIFLSSDIPEVENLTLWPLRPFLLQGSRDLESTTRQLVMKTAPDTAPGPTMSGIHSKPRLPRRHSLRVRSISASRERERSAHTVTKSSLGVDEPCPDCALVDLRTALAESLGTLLCTSMPSHLIPLILTHPESASSSAKAGDIGNTADGGDPSEEPANPRASDNWGGANGQREGQDGNGSSPRDRADLASQASRRTLGFICVKHRHEPQVYGTRSSRSRWHKCETKEWTPFSELLWVFIRPFDQMSLPC